MKRFIIPILFILFSFFCISACADPARTDGTATAWIGEENALFLNCTDGVTRKLSAPMKDIPGITETDFIGLTQAGQIVSVKKDGSGYTILSETASEAELAAMTDRLFLLEDGKLTAGDTVYSERAVLAATDGLVLYWINKGDNGYTLMQKEMPGKGQDAFGRSPVSLTGMTVPEPIYLCVTAEALTLTAADQSIVNVSLKTGESKVFPASGQETAAACMADERLYRYTFSEQSGWSLATIQNDAMKLATVTPAPTSTPVPTAVPTQVPVVTPRTTAVPTATPRSSQSEDNNIYKGARGNTVRKIQRRLLELGYPVGSVDGVYGEQTQIAVNLFYDAIHVRERSYITPSMYKKLFASNAPVYDPYLPLQKGDRGLSVLYMQMMLRKIGYDPEKVDGIYGDLTVKAVADYQKLIGYVPAEKEVPGEYASRELLERLFGPEPTPSAVPTDTPKPTNSPAPTGAPEPTAEPSSKPTSEPTSDSTAEPSAEPTAEPSAEPTAEPSTEPTAEPSAEPTAEQTAEPTTEPTAEPSAESTDEPTAEP